MHPRLHVPRRRTAGHGRGHQNPEQACEDSVLGDGVWGIDDVPSATRVGPHEHDKRRQKGPRNRARCGRGAPGTRTQSERSPGTSRSSLRLLVLTSPADASCHRAEVDIFEVWLGGLKAGTGRRIAVDVGDGASRVELRRDHRVLSFQIRESFPRNHAAARSGREARQSPAAVRLRAESPLCR